MKSFIAGMALAAAAVVSASPVAFVSPAPDYTFNAGFNLGANNPDGSCKSIQDWTDDFNTVIGWSKDTKFNTFKLYSTNDCDTLKNAVPAALATGAKIWAGVWAVDANKYSLEKAALEYAIQTWGYSWLVGINVGSESLYRNEISANDLANQIYDVKGMVQLHYNATTVPVGCADTWTMWVRPNNSAVIAASDVILMNGFPYWQGATIETSKDVFLQSIADTKAAIGNTPFVIGETGWPTGGANYTATDVPGTGPAVPSIPNLTTFWKESGCALIAQKIPFFWFSAFDEPQESAGVEQNFGIALSSRDGRALKFDSLQC